MADPIYVSSGVTSTGLILNKGRMYVNSGGTANNTTVNYLGMFYVNYGGVATGTTVNNGCELIVYSGGRATSTTVNLAGGLRVSSGGTANNTTVNSNGWLYVFSGGKVTGKMTFETDAHASAYNGAIIDFDISSVEPDNDMLINDLSRVSGWGDALFSLTVGGTQSNGTYSLAAGAAGFSKSITVQDASGETLGTLTVDGGTKIFGQKKYTLNLDASRLAVTVNDLTPDLTGDLDSEFRLTNGMYGSSVNILDGGILYVSSGGRVDDVTVNSGGDFYVWDAGGTATNIKENGGYVFDHENATVTFLPNSFGGYTYSGTHWASIHSGTTGTDLTAISSGEILVFSGGVVQNVTAASRGSMSIRSGGTADGVTISSGGRIEVLSGGKVTGRLTKNDRGVFSTELGSIIDFDLTQTAPGEDALVNDLGSYQVLASLTLTVDGTEAAGKYKLVGYVNSSYETRTITVVNKLGETLGTLTVAGGTQTIGGVDYTLNLGDDYVLSVTVGAAALASAKSDIDGNGISDVLFQYTGGFGQIGFWMNGTNEWKSTNATHPVDTWDVLGAYDMDSNGKADSVLVGNVEISGIRGAFIGYYTDAEDLDSNWVNISYLTNNEGYVWKNKVGNLTGNAGKNSIVWHCADIGALGVWTDGTDSWVGLGPGGYDANWTLVGCGDFDGDGKDSVLMSYAGGVKYYTVGIDGVASELATSDSGWEVRAIADFAGDGKDDIIAFHKETGIVAMWGNGKSSNWSQLGQLDPKDWFVAGAGDYNGDGKDDLLVRQYSTGMLGYYSAGNMSNWTELGRGVDMSWTVIA